MRYLFVSIILLCCISVRLHSQHRFILEILPGAAYILPSSLTIHQEGFEDIQFSAKYRVDPFRFPVYYSIRAGRQITESLTLELEFNHLKVYLDNNPPEIQNFSISHGYNQFWFGILQIFKHFDLRAGLGPVIAHPENTVRNMKHISSDGGLFDNGYYLDGITSQLAIQKRFHLHKNFFLSVESKFNASFSRCLVVNGYADVSIYALHGLIGIGAIL